MQCCRPTPVTCRHSLARAWITTIVLILFFAAPEVAHAQGNWIVDTLFAEQRPFNKGGVSYVTHGDTIVGVWHIPGDERGQMLMRSTDKGDTWDSIYHSSLYLSPQVPTMGLGMAGIQNRVTYATRDGWSVNADSTGLRFLPDDIHPVRHNLHPFRLNESFVKCNFDGPIQDIYADFWFHRVSDDSAWREIIMPRHSLGIARGADITFDYSNPDRLWLSIDGGFDQTGSLFEFDRYYSDDVGRTWTKVDHEIPPLMGMFKPGYGLRWTNRGNTIYKEPSLYNPITGDSIHLGWYEKIRAEFAKHHSLDGWNFTMHSTTSTAPNVIGGYWVHPKNRRTILAHVTANRIGDIESEHTALALTEDAGDTWQFLERVRPYRNGNSAIVPVRTLPAVVSNDGSTVLVPMYEWVSDNSDWTVTRTLTLRYRRKPTQVSMSPLEDSVCSITPQPADHTVSITIPNTSSLIRHVALYDVTGACVMQADHEPTQQIMLAVGSLPSGVYVAHVTTTLGSKVLPLWIVR
jgi:hypothetical protein